MATYLKHDHDIFCCRERRPNLRWVVRRMLVRLRPRTGGVSNLALAVADSHFATQDWRSDTWTSRHELQNSLTLVGRSESQGRGRLHVHSRILRDSSAIR